RHGCGLSRRHHRAHHRRRRPSCEHWPCRCRLQPTPTCLPVAPSPAQRQAIWPWQRRPSKAFSLSSVSLVPKRAPPSRGIGGYFRKRRSVEAGSGRLTFTRMRPMPALRGGLHFLANCLLNPPVLGPKASSSRRPSCACPPPPVSFCLPP